MDSAEVSFRIRATAAEGEPEELYLDAWELLAATIARNARHPSAREVLQDYLPETKADGVGASTRAAISFVFLSPSSACDVQMAVAAHWFELAIALAQGELAALALRHGFALRPSPKDARALADAKRAVPFVPDGRRLVGVRPGKRPLVLVDAEGETPLEEAELSRPAAKAALEVARTRRCACPFCATLRAGKAAAAKPPKKKAAAPEPPPAAGAPPPLAHFTSLAKAIKHADRCGSVRDVPPHSSLVVPAGLERLRHVKELELGHLEELPPALFELTTLEALSFGYGVLTPVPTEYALPAAVGQLVNLKRLRVPCTITRLPPALGALSKLERLDLSGTLATALPAALTRLTSLRALSLKNARRLRKRLPDLGRLVALEELDLSLLRSPVRRPLDDIDFSRLTRLRLLDLSGAKLDAFPATLRGMPSLHHLRLEQTPLTDLPATFSTLEALAQLDAWASAFDRWPAALNGLPSLRTIDLRQSKIKEADALASLPALETLVLSNTPLARLPARAPALPRLRTLALDGTPLTHLPDWVAKLPALERLSVTRTPLAPGALDAVRRRRSITLVAD